MKLWKISQNVNNGYDTYDSAVVAAETMEAARETHPSVYFDLKDTDPFKWSNWCEFEMVSVRYLGEAKEGTKAGVICASFNAG